MVHGFVDSFFPPRFRELPLNRLLFLSEAALAGVGHDFNPLIFSAKGDLEFQGKAS